MNDERDELTRIIMTPESFDGGPASCGPNDVYATRTADAILAAGYRQPRTVTTVEELDALPNDAVVLSDTIAYQKYGHESWAADGRFYINANIPLPATVLHIGATQ